MTEPKTILVVDDDPDFLLQQQLQLEAAGFRVLVADGQAKAEELIAGNAPDLAILDLMMENFDAGFVLCHRIKKLHPGTPVILVTAVTSRDRNRLRRGHSGRAFLDQGRRAPGEADSLRGTAPRDRPTHRLKGS